MIRINIPGLYDSDFSSKTDMRLGDAQIIDDGKNYEVIDGYCGAGTTHLIDALKARGIKRPYLHISHAHYDHYYGIRKIIADTYFKPRRLYMYDPDSLNGSFSNAIRNEINTMKAIAKEAKAKGIPVTYLKNGDKITHGEISFTVYRDQPTSFSGNSDAYINDGSLCYYFPTLSYLTTGDAGMWAVERYGLKPKFVKGGHHGNRMDGDDLKPSQMAPIMKKNGCLYYWDNDYSTKLTDFLMTGRDDAINAKMTIFNIHGDINMIAQNGYVSIYKDYKVYRYRCSYSGKTTLKQPTLDTVIDTLKGEYGNGNTRITRLIDAGFYPIATQNKINEIISLLGG